MIPYTFFVLVAAMRRAQREYFKTRSSADLSTAKRLEREVDKEMEKIREKDNNESA